MDESSETPSSEISGRIRRLQALLQEEEIELALLRQNADLYYFTGTVQDGHLLVPGSGEPLFLVWRVLERALNESSLARIEPLPGLRALSGILKKHGLLRSRTLGLELDTLPAASYLRYTQDVWPEATPRDITHLIRLVRAVKSPWEVDQIQAAARQVMEVIAEVPAILRAGMRELDLAAAVEGALRRAGHPGFVRMRGWNQELLMGQILSGENGAVPSWILTPAGGAGLTAAFGQSASRRLIQEGEPVSIDLGGSVAGYLCDQTRLFVIGALPEDLFTAYESVLALHHDLAGRLRPGAVCGELFAWARREMEVAGYGAHFMGFGTTQVRFLGHGVGIEIDEYPFLAKDNPMVLAPGMVVAVEPKLIFPGRGLVGIEDTYLITEREAQRLTLSLQELVCI